MSLGLNPGILSVGIGSVGGQGEFLGGIKAIDGSGIGHDIGAGFFGHEEGFGVRNGVVGDGVDRKRNGGGHGGHGGHGECIEVRGDDVKLGIAEVEGLEVGLNVAIVGGFFFFFFFFFFLVEGFTWDKVVGDIEGLKVGMTVDIGGGFTGGKVLGEVEGLEVGLTVGIVGGFTGGRVLGGQYVGVSGIHSCGHGKKQSQKEA